MKINKISKIMVFPFLFFVHPAFSLDYNPFQVFKKNRIDLNLNTQYFKTESNFAADGSKQDLSSGQSYQNIEVSADLRWEAFEDIGFIVGTHIGNSESSTATLNRKNSSLSGVDMGIDYYFWNSSFHEAFARFIYTHPLDKVNPTSDDVMNSEGVSEIKPEAVIRFDFDGIYLFGQAGLNFRSEGLSTLATYSSGIEMRFLELGVGAFVDGYMSITDDSATASPLTRENYTNQVNAGSKRYYSVNPNSNDVGAYLIFAPSRNLVFKFYGQYTVVGSNTSQGITAGLQMNFNFDLKKSTTSEPQRVYKKSPTVLQQPIVMPSKEQKGEQKLVPKNEVQFQEDTNDGVDQNYFRQVEPNQEEYIKKVEQALPAKDPVQKPRPARKIIEAAHSEQQTNEKIKNQINEMEYKIKLKKAKKK